MILLMACFNWATSFQTWKLREVTMTLKIDQIGLQLGHVFSDMEMEPPEIGVYEIDDVLQLGHVFSDMEI